MTEISLAVHGGAGGPSRAPSESERDGLRRKALAAALRSGHEILSLGGSALDAVVAAVVVLEDDEVFNAGPGSVLRSDGGVVMDASLMDGATAQAGAVAGVRRIRNPIRGARCVLDDGRYVLLSGTGAEDFVSDRGVMLADPQSFVTEARARQLESTRRRQSVLLDHDAEGLGTVGAVARDANGHLAAATSTGGMTNALASRIGDSPLIGAGTWADDATCAVSGTGEGEIFMRSAFAHEIDARIRLAGESIAEACTGALARVVRLGGVGGGIALAAEGQPVLDLTTSAMPRGAIGADGVARIALLAGEPLRPAS
ncbi:MAG: isoaspartyl peptidase/L-asparaginase [bacterium]|nr:isoaspartyl peptidase/L-asparaginase [bacterium]